MAISSIFNIPQLISRFGLGSELLHFNLPQPHVSGPLLLMAITFMPNGMAATTPDGLCAALRAADLLRPGTTIDPVSYTHLRAHET